MSTSIDTSAQIALITTNLGFSCTTFKSYEELLETILVKRFNEYMSCSDNNPNLAAYKIKTEIVAKLKEIIKAEKDEPEEVCPISEAKDCGNCNQLDRCVEINE